MRVRWLLLVVSMLVGLALWPPGLAAAQERPRAPARLIAAVGDCLTIELGTALNEPASREELPDG